MGKRGSNHFSLTCTDSDLPSDEMAGSSLSHHMVSDTSTCTWPHLEGTDLTPGFQGGLGRVSGWEFRNPLESFD
jgi:hypothetical protein